MNNEDNYITYLRKGLREYLKSDLSLNNISQEKAVILATAINEKITHQIKDLTLLNTAMSQLSAQYPELSLTFDSINQKYSFEKKRRLIDESILKLVDANELDKALEELNQLLNN